jgi:hypothetical protein
MITNHETCLGIKYRGPGAVRRTPARYKKMNIKSQKEACPRSATAEAFRYAKKDTKTINKRQLTSSIII